MSFMRYTGLKNKLYINFYKNLKSLITSHLFYMLKKLIIILIKHILKIFRKLGRIIIILHKKLLLFYHHYL